MALSSPIPLDVPVITAIFSDMRSHFGRSLYHEGGEYGLPHEAQRPLPRASTPGWDVCLVRHAGAGRSSRDFSGMAAGAVAPASRPAMAIRLACWGLAATSVWTSP